MPSKELAPVASTALAVISEPSASDLLIRQLTTAVDAYIGVIAVRCAETEVYRVLDEIYSLASQHKVQFLLHTTETGWGTFDSMDVDDERAPVFNSLVPKHVSPATADTLKAFQDMYETGNIPNDAYLVMLDLFHTFEEPKTQNALRKQGQRALNNGQRLFIVVPNHAKIPDAIAPLLHIIEYGYPSRDELRVTVNDTLENVDREASGFEITEEEIETLISNGQGMTTTAFETAIAFSITEYGTMSIEDGAAIEDAMQGFSAEYIIQTVRNYKTQLLRKTDVLELQRPETMENIGGLEQFKSWMMQRKETFTDKAKEFGVTPSRGAMVVGPPGTGKSLAAKAAGNALGLPVIRFDVGKVFGSFIGQSEQSMRGVLSMLDAMAPCVLMLDEVDKGFSGMTSGGGDSGTTMRVFGTFLTWMQERDQINRPVFLIMTANRIEGLPPELLRRGRIDEIWSVGLPNEDERRAILHIHSRKRGQIIDEKDMPGLIRITENLVGAEIEAMVEDALVLSLSTKKPGLTYEIMEQARNFLKPMSETRKIEFDAMQSWAEKNARMASIETTRVTPRKAPATVKRGRIKARVKRDDA